MIIFDVETTGLPKADIVDLTHQPSIIEFAAIKLDDKTLEPIEQIEFLVNPNKPLSKKITDITGLTDKDLIDAKPFDWHYMNLVKFFFAEKYVFAHNASFDLSLLKFELRRLGRLTQFPWPPIQICTMNQTFKFKNYRLSLQKLHQYLFGENFGEAHRAMNDVKALTKCVKELIKREVIVIST